MATTAQNKQLLKTLGWESVDEVPDSIWERLDAESAHRQEHSMESVLKYVSTFYEAFKKEDAYIIVSDGAEFITVNAECLMTVSASPETGRKQTGFYTIGSSDKAVFEWVTWAAQGCDADNRPDYGFNYVS